MGDHAMPVTQVVSRKPFTTITPSGSQPGESWRTTMSNDGLSAVCDCPAYMRSGTCAHVRETVSLFAVDQRAAAEAAAEASQALTPYKPAPVAVRPAVALMPTYDELRAMTALAKALVETAGFAIPKDLDDPRKIFAVINAGRDRGVRPMVALNHFFVVNGRVEMDSQIMMAIVLSREPDARFKFTYQEEDGCAVELWRHGELVSKGKWTQAQAERAGLLKRPTRKIIERWEKRTRANGSEYNVPIYKRENGKEVEEEYDGRWQMYPDDMYMWKAVKRACVTGAADLLNAVEGVATVPDELPTLRSFNPAAPLPEPTDILGNTGGVSVDAPIVPAAAPESPAGDEESEGAVYAWFPHFRALQERHAVQDSEVCRFLRCPSDLMLIALEEWLFRDGDVHDLDARVDTLIRGVLAQRPEGDHRG